MQAFVLIKVVQSESNPDLDLALIGAGLKRLVWAKVYANFPARKCGLDI